MGNTQSSQRPRPLYRSPYFVRSYEHLHRVLRRPHLVGIGISGCVGAGIFVTSGSLIAMSGSLGGPLAYIVAGSIVACVMYTMSEMAACRPLTGALIDFPHTFLDPACGFAVSASYALANICSMVTLTEQSTELTGLLRQNPGRPSLGAKIGLDTFFIILTAVSHCLGVQLYGRIERVIMWFKFCLILLVIILMIIINAGGGGPRSTPYYSNYTTYGFTPGFKPVGFNSVTQNLTLSIRGADDSNFGIGGPGGRLFAFLTAVTLAMFSCMGGDIIIMTAGEAEEPWTDIPAVTSFVYAIPLSLYPLMLLAAGSNVNYADPNLAKIWGPASVSQSPFVTAVQHSSLRGLPYALNFFFVISAYTAANTAMYVASRAVFMCAQNYLPQWFAKRFGRTNNGGTPIWAIGFCSVLGFLSLIGVINDEYSQPRITLSQFYTGSVACVYVSECMAFLKFKAGLDRLDKQKILSRDDPLYIHRLFKSRWQPRPAYVGIVGCLFVITWSGVPPLFIIAARQNLSSSPNLKKNVALAFDVVGAYIGPIVFLLLYFFYKYVFPRSKSVDIRHLTVDKYILPNVSSFEETGPNDNIGRVDSVVHSQPGPNIHELSDIEGEASRTAGSNTNRGRAAVGNVSPEADDTDSEDVSAEDELERAQKRERQRALGLLEKRPVRRSRGFWGEVCSFIISD